jgi:Domain of unknown function (DUF4118)
MIEKLRRTLAPWCTDWAGRAKETLHSRLWIAPGLACVGVAVAAHFVLAELIQDFAPSILYNTAIFGVAVWAGIPAGFVAVGLSTLLMLLMWLGLNSFGLGSDAAVVPQAIDLAIFALVAILIIWIGGRYRALAVPCLQQGNEYRSGSALFLKLHRFFLEGLPPNSLSAYTFALLCIGVATLIRSGFALSSGNVMPLVSYYPAVLLSALIGGAGAGLLAIVASLVAVWSEYPGPFFSAGVPGRDESVSLAVYVFGSLLSVWIAENHRPRIHGELAPQPRTLRALSSVLVAFSAILLTSVVLLAVDSFLDAKPLIFVYLLPTVVIAMHYGSTFAVLTSVASGLAAAYFFFPPKFSFYIADPLNVAELGFFLLLAAIAGKAVAAVTHDARANKAIRARARSR